MARLARLALVLPVLAAAAAAAFAVEGGRPPALEAKEWVGAPLKWEERRGKVTIVALVEPDDGRSKEAVVELADMLQADAKRGLGVCLVSQASRRAMEDFLARQKNRQPFVVAAGEMALRAYFGTTMTPFAAVVNRDGVIVWEGPWSDRIGCAEAVKSALERPPTVSRATASKRFAPVWKALDAKDTRAAIAALLEILKDAAGKERQDAEALLLKIEIEAQKRLRKADEHYEAGEYLDACEQYEAIAHDYEGLELAKAPAESAANMREDKKLKKELEAWAVIREARALEAAGKKKDAAHKYRVVVSKWKGTKAAELAKKKADELEAKKG